MADHHVCPWWLMYFHPPLLRKMVQSPQKILSPLVQAGQTILDVGCGFGYYTIPLAKMVGETGHVIAADLQAQMLRGTRRKAKRAGVEDRIMFHQCESDQIGYQGAVDGVLAFYVVHEVPHAETFLEEVRSILKPGGFFLVSEPKYHVSKDDFDKMVFKAKTIGFQPSKSIHIIQSRTQLFCV